MNEFVSPSSLSEKILQSLRKNPGQKARDLARNLKVERSGINSLLYSLLRGKVIPDKNYRGGHKTMQSPSLNLTNMVLITQN